ncbi:RNA polymerase sigma factor [Actinoallomurus iriomotensis]|uniref:Sigma-70 family RNA polymerase sigma factor n=1 Tax=Actinoallomurus iriomotensis TaxID=478107 RepID=A0A9W6RPE7_9ACTN|nr:sigma-70 family RNA polymerase sigma factor [Actinoallomurus iriomotensis]GLY79368.1 hypothetical protein Airi01_076350 [Actinoallomurus iriomotensis]
MAGWPSLDRNADRRLAASLDAGDADALPQIYDAYGPRLFDYCHVLLRDQEAAAQALHDTLIIVRERAGRLPYALFRGRLYGVARKECLRRRADAAPPAERLLVPEAAGAEADEATRPLVRAALHVLSAAQREALDLFLRHELDADELAEVLGMSPHEVSMHVAQARHDLDEAFSAVLVAATGREECSGVEELAPPGTPLDTTTCGRLARHIASCPICGSRRDLTVTNAQLLQAMPTAALPGTLRSRVLDTASAPALADLRATIARRADPPPPEPGAVPEPDHAGRRRWPVVAAVACVLLVVSGVFLLLPGPGQDEASGRSAPSGSSSADSPLVGSPEPAGGPTPSPTPVKKTPKPAPPTPYTRRPSSPQRPGTLSVTGCHMPGTRHCSVKVTARGGPVAWRVTETTGTVTASGGGRLRAGQSTSVTVTRTDRFCIGVPSASVTFNANVTATVTFSC